jgi:DNA-binding SARP family transcriptional activator
MRTDDVCLNLLGRFELLVGGVDVPLPLSAQRVIVFLALHDRPQRRPVVAGNLWPEKSEGRAAANLRSALWRARVPGGQSLVAAHGPLLTLSRHVIVDVQQMQLAGWRLVEGYETASPTRADGSQFFEDLLPGWYDDWVILERERITQLRMHFLEAIVDRLVSAGGHAAALDIAFRLIAADPLRERSFAALARVYEAEGSLHRARACQPSPPRARLIRAGHDWAAAT